MPRALGLADRHERDARAHQAAQEPQGEDRLVGGPRADADAGDARRARARDPGARAAALLARQRPASSTRARATPATWFDPAFAAGDDDEAPRRPHLRRGARAARSSRAVAGQRGRRRRDAQAVARVGAAALRPHQPPARGQPPLRLVGAAHALRRAALLRGATSCSPIRAPTRAACPSDYRATVRRDAARPSRASRAASEGFADCAAAAARLLERGLENEARIFDDAGVSDHFAIIPTGALPAPSLTGDDKRALRPRGAPLPRRLPPARRSGSASSASREVAGEQLPHARAHPAGAGLARGARRRGRRGATARRPLPPLVARRRARRAASPVALARGRARGRGDASRPPRITRGAPALADGERRPAHRGRGPRGGAPREGHRHARDARRHHREPDRQGLRGARSARRCARP